MKHVVAELMDDDWVSNHKDIALYYRGGRQQGQLKTEMETSPYLCQICIDKIEAEAEAAAVVAAEREAKATAVVAAMKRKVEANTAKEEAEAARAYCLILMIGCFICVSVSVGVCGWCFMRS